MKIKNILNINIAVFIILVFVFSPNKVWSLNVPNFYNSQYKYSLSYIYLGKIDSSKTSKNRQDTTFTFRHYYGTLIPHTMDQSTIGGSFIVLDDGSYWEIDPRDIYSASLWGPLSIITVQKSSSRFSAYNYILINNDNDEVVRAMYIGGR